MISTRLLLLDPDPALPGRPYIPAVQAVASINAPLSTDPMPVYAAAWLEREALADLLTRKLLAPVEAQVRARLLEALPYTRPSASAVEQFVFELRQRRAGR